MWRRARAAVAALAVVLGATASYAQSPPWRALTQEASYPEGPLWDGATLLVAEMGADRVSRFGQNRARSTLFAEAGCGPTAIAPYRTGYAVLCHQSGEVLAIDRRGRVRARFGADAGVDLRNPNDGAADGRGGVYFSDPGPFSRRYQPQGRLVRLSPDGRLREVAAGLAYPNGVFVATDAAGAPALYVSEHLARKVWIYPIETEGSLGQRRLFVDVDRIAPPVRPARFTPYDLSGPDGLERGPDGSWRIALYGEGRVLHVDGAGRLLGVVETPFQFATNVAVLPSGRWAAVGAYENDRPPFSGAVLLFDPTRTLP